MQRSTISLEINGFAWSFLKFHWVYIYLLYINISVRMQLSEMSLETYGLANSFLQFHWKSNCSHKAFLHFHWTS